jgi:hypothetical protein
VQLGKDEVVRRLDRAGAALTTGAGA